MIVLDTFLQVFAATMLLLFAVKTVQKGIEAQASVALRRAFLGPKNRLKSAVAGLAAAVVLQSSAAVVLLTVNFVGAGGLGFVSALAAVLGADFGSALVVLILSFRVDWLMGLCLATGGWLYLRAQGPRPRQIGQVILGIGLVLLSLNMLSLAFEPVRSNTHWPAIMTYLASDLFVAFLVGAILAFAIHSSVAALLMCVALADIGAIPLPVGVALTLGANLGSSLIPLWLTKGAANVSRRVVVANALLRGSAATITILIALLLWPHLPLQIGSPGQTLLFVHISFNAALLFALPGLPYIGKVMQFAMPDPNRAPDALDQWQIETCLVQNTSGNPSLALANMRREVLRMATFLNAMANPSLALYRDPNRQEHARIRRMDTTLQAGLDRFRSFASDIPTEKLSKAERRELRDLVDIAIDLTAAGHIIADRLVSFAETAQTDGISFSKDGWAELGDLHKRVLENMAMAFGAIAADDAGLARTVVQAKTDIRKLERKSRKQHFGRLRAGGADSVMSSDLHLETLRAFKELNSKITETVYPMLSRAGQLAETRLVPVAND